MTTKSDFNAEEWEVLASAPALVALRVIAADRGGTLRESLSLARAYGEARQRAGEELLTEILSSPPQLAPAQVRNPEEVQAESGRRLGEALELLESKGTPDEVKAYKGFVMHVADTVARAHREGGVLGIGGKEVSEREQAVLDDLSTRLGGENR
jgi:hypothetical protein